MDGEAGDCGVVALEVADEGVVMGSQVSDGVFMQKRLVFAHTAKGGKGGKGAEGRDYGSAWYWHILCWSGYV